MRIGKRDYASIRLLRDFHDAFEGVFGPFLRLDVVDEAKNFVAMLLEKLAAQSELSRR